MGMKLDIGAGNPAEGENQAGKDYVLQDVEEHPGIDIVCDIRQLDYELIRKFQKLIGEGRSDVCSEIRASHVLEHFHMKELVGHILPMLKRCLQKDGLLVNKYKVLLSHKHLSHKHNHTVDTIQHSLLLIMCMMLGQLVCTRP